MKNSIKAAVIIVAIMWIVFVLNSIIVAMDFNSYGILPRRTDGLKGILFCPFLHGSLSHIISNTVPMLVLTSVLFWFYRRFAIKVLVLSTLMGGGLVWIFGREAYHIGASGVIFALVGFLIASGIFRKNIKALLIGILIVFLYGGVIWGIFPNQPGVSWEGHLFGFLSGILLAYVFKNEGRK